jgi:DNA-binding CsgD family transcriptional regulator
MVKRKKNYIFIKYFYRWDVISLCIIFGFVILWFYYKALTGICRYPSWFPLVVFTINNLLLIISTFIMKRPSKPEIRLRIHHFVMFILLIINPMLVVAFSENFLSILWTLSISTYLLFCLFFIRYKKIDRIITGIPFATFLVHLIFRIFTGNVTVDIVFSGLFGILMSLFYGLFYILFKFYLDNTQESLSVYLNNKDISEFLIKYNLTKREQEICFCIVNGYSAKKAAEKLGIAFGTVKNHTKKIYKKIGINSRMELMHLIWDFTLLYHPQQKKRENLPASYKNNSKKT